MSGKPKKSSGPDSNDTAFPIVARMWDFVRNGSRTNREINAWLDLFSPNSAGSQKARAQCALVSAHDTIPLICKLAELARAPLAVKPIQSLCKEGSAANLADELARLFTSYGSDKATGHDYHILYAALLSAFRTAPVRLLEIGLGTNNTDVLSNMGKTGAPGASLRAFRDFLPRGEIFGADVDRRILFSEDRIATYFVDQTRQETFRDLRRQLGPELFDLVIDDGLHSPDANLRTLIFALEMLRPGGYAVIEDIHERSLAIWRLVGTILSRNHEAYVVPAKQGNLFVVRKQDSTA